MCGPAGGSTFLKIATFQIDVSSAYSYRTGRIADFVEHMLFSDHHSIFARCQIWIFQFRDSTSYCDLFPRSFARQALVLLILNYSVYLMSVLEIDYGSYTLMCIHIIWNGCKRYWQDFHESPDDSYYNNIMRTCTIKTILVVRNQYT